MNRLIILFACLIGFILKGYTQTWFNQETIDCVVLLEKKVDNNFIPHGTGFLLFNYLKPGRFIVVTCEHVLRNKEIYVLLKADSTIIKEMNKQNKNVFQHGDNIWTLDGSLLRTKVDLVEGKTFFKHDRLDIAAFYIDIFKGLEIPNLNDTTRIYFSKSKSLGRSSIIYKDKISLGMDVYFLGFPFMIGTDKGFVISSKYGSFPSGNYKDNVSNPLLRSGIISWISNNEDEFLLDAFSYGGNSGSPVFTKNTLTQKGPQLAGMVIGHLGDDIDLNIPDKSQVGKKVEFNSIGNSGLARCLWSDDIMTVVKKIESIKE